jgi:flagellin
MIINHNISALNTLNRLTKNNKKTANALEKLSSGLRINKASDDSAGLAISEKMRAQIRGLQQAQRNIQDGISLLQTAEGGLAQIQSSLLQRLRELAIQSLNDTLTDEDRQEIQKEVKQILDGINEIANNTIFNGIKVISSQDKIKNISKTVISWREIDTGYVTNSYYYDVAWNGNIYLAVGYAGQVLRSDDNGETWYQPFSPVNSVNLHTIEFDGSNFIITENTNLYKSPDGYSRNGAFFPSSPSAGRLYDADFVGGKYITVGEGGFIGVSNDFVNWTEISSVTSVDLMDVASNGTSYVIVGENGTILHSYDGINWNDVSLSSLSTITLHEVIYNEGKYVAVGGNKVITSTDGVNWVEAYTAPNASLVDIKYDGEGFIGLGRNGYIIYSDDGVNWEEHSMNFPTDTLTAIEWDGNEYLAIGYGGKFYKGRWEKNIEKESQKVNLQIGANSGNTFQVELTDARTTALGIDDIDLSSRQGAELAISKIEKALEIVSSERSKIGAYQNRLEHALNNASNYEINLTTSESRITDADMARQMMELTKNQILTQASQAMLTQASQQPQQVLQLLK